MIYGNIRKRRRHFFFIFFYFYPSPNVKEFWPLPSLQIVYIFKILSLEINTFDLKMTVKIVLICMYVF